MNRFIAVKIVLIISLITCLSFHPYITTFAQTTSNQQKGDANNDGKVDGLDYVVWLTQYNQLVTPETRSDFNTDGKVNGVDYVIWLTNYNTVIASASPYRSYFPYGIFEDGNQWKGTPAISAMQTDLTDLKARGIDDILFTNYTPHVDMLDNNQFHVVAAPMDQLNPQWWENITVTQSLTVAKTIAQPIVDALKTHSSIVAYNLADDSAGFTTNKLQLISQAFSELDPSHPALLTQPGVDKYIDTPTPIYLAYMYPAKTTNNQCDFNSKSIRGRYVNNFSQLLEVDRETLQLQEKNIPFWFVLQTHGTSAAVNPSATNVNNLRTPNVEEVRLQNWLAISEGVKGIYWFIYRTQQFWIGLKDNQPLLTEVTDLTRRVTSLATTLLPLTNYEQQLYTVTTTNILPLVHQPMVKTLRNKSNNTWYIVVINHSCNDQNITIHSQFTTHSLKDIETGTTYNLSQAIPFRGGDGKVFQVNGDITPPPIINSTNIVKNNSFEIGTDFPADWTSRSGFSKDITNAHTGSTSLKITGPLSSNYVGIPVTTNLKPNTKYSVSFWVKTDGISNQGISMRYVHVLPSLGLTPLGMRWINGTSAWQKVSKEFYTFTEVTQSRFDLLFDLTNGGTAWVDDITVCEGNLSCVPSNP